MVKERKRKWLQGRRSETGDHYNQIDTGNSGFLGGWFGGGKRKYSTWDDYLTDEEDYA